MQPESGQIQIGNVTRGIKAGQDVAQFFCMIATDPSRIVFFVKALQSLMPDRANHGSIVTRYVTHVKWGEKLSMYSATMASQDFFAGVVSAGGVP